MLRGFISGPPTQRVSPHAPKPNLIHSKRAIHLGIGECDPIPVSLRDEALRNRSKSRGTSGVVVFKCAFSHPFFWSVSFSSGSRFMQINCFAPEAPLGAYISALVFILLLFLAWVSLFLHKFQPSSCALNLLLSGASSVYAQMKTSAEKDVGSSIWRLCHSALDKCINPAASAEASPLGSNRLPFKE